MSQAAAGPVVLLIDDQAIVGEAVRRLLGKETDIAYHACTDPERALALAGEVRPTVILQDLVMPGVDGFTLLERLRAAPATAQVPVIVLSSKEDPRDKSRAFSLGASDYLVKLPDRIELVARIRAHSNRYQLTLERDEAYRRLQELQRQLEEKNQILQALSTLDGLTGIANRRRYDDALDQEWRRATRDGTPLSIILIDVDFFKRYNDHYGHQAGDDCLRQVAAALVGGLRRAHDLAARYGGEEFVALLPNTEAAGAAAVAETLRARIAGLAIAHARSEVAPHVTISLGVATLRPRQGDLAAQLVALADEALYAAKRAGRDRWRQPE